MPIYMKYDGIDGHATEKNHEKWIELESCQLGVNRHITAAAQGNRESSAPSVSEIVLTKHQDEASTNLFKAALFGEGKKVKIDFCKTSTDGKEQQMYLQLELENTLVSSFTTSGHGGDGGQMPMESLSLNFTKITYKHIGSDQKNKAAKPQVAVWDLASGRSA